MELAEKFQSFLIRSGKRAGVDLAYFVNNGFWMSMKIGVYSLSAIVFYAAFSRLASQEVFGKFQLIFTIVSMSFLFSLPGLNTSLLRSVARGFEGDYQAVVRKSFLWSMGGSVIMIVSGGFYYFMTEFDRLGIALFLIGFLFPFLYAPNTWEVFLIGKDRFRLLAFFASTQAFFLYGIVILVMYLFKDNLIAIALSYYLLQSFFNILYYYKTKKLVANDWKDKDVFPYGYFLTKVNCIEILANNIDKFLVGLLLGPEDLAIYTIISLIAIKFREILKMFTNLLFPKMARLSIKFSEFARNHKSRIIALFAMLVVSSVLYYLFIGRVTEILFTERYSAYLGLSQIFSISILLSFPLTFMAYYVNATKNEFAIIISSPVFSGIKIALNLYLIMKFGLLGAVWAYNGSMILLLFLYVIGVFMKEHGLARNFKLKGFRFSK